MYVRQPGRGTGITVRARRREKGEAYPGGAESLSDCEPLSASRCDVLNAVRPLAESKGLIDIRARPRIRRPGRAAPESTPLAMSPLVVMALRRLRVPTTQVLKQGD